MTEPAKKNFTKHQAIFLLAHSSDYGRDMVEVTEEIFDATLGLDGPPNIPQPAPSRNWREDDEEAPGPEKQYKEFDAYFHPDLGISGAEYDDKPGEDRTDLLFYRPKLEKEAGMSASAARHRFKHTQSVLSIGV